MSDKVEDFGKECVLTQKVWEWLDRLGTKVYHEGHYTQGIYLHTLCENAEVHRTCPCKIRDRKHYHQSDDCPECGFKGKEGKNQLRVCPKCLHQWFNGLPRPCDRPETGDSPQRS